jgi:hypothetical protein
MQDLKIGFDRLSSPENRLYLGIFVGLLAMTAMVGCLVLYQFMKAPQPTTPQLVLAPKTLATNPLEPTSSALTFIATETSIVPTPSEILTAPTAKVKSTARVKPPAGQSCNYSSLSLNQTLPPVPDGSWSPIEHFLCDNGYWDIGQGDVVDRKTGAWGQDGIAEKILIKYDSNGQIADRIFVDPEGKQFSGPKN